MKESVKTKLTKRNETMHLKKISLSSKASIEKSHESNANKSIQDIMIVKGIYKN